MPRSVVPIVARDLLQRHDADGHPLAAIRVGSSAWFAWLTDESVRAFSYHTSGGAVTMRRERKGGHAYWYAYRRQGRRIRKAYLGKDAELTSERLRAVAVLLDGTTTGGASGVHLLLLGPVEIRRDGRPVRLSMAKAVALLGYLAVTGVPQPRDRLLALLWPESTTLAARKNLRNMLWSVRTTLGDVIVEQNARLALHPAVTSDIALLAQYTPATPDGALAPALGDTALVTTLLAHYRGPLLDTLVVAGAPEFELWLLEAREQLQQNFLRLVRALIARAQAQQDWPQVLALGERALAVDPLQEEVYRALMSAHAARAEPTEALRRYAQLRSTLARELDVAPTAATEALRQRLTDPIKIESAPRTDSRQAHTLLSPPFIGRAPERALLDQALRAARAGQAQGVLLVGEPGVGKTQLWQVWSAALRGEQQLMELRGAATARDIPLAPLLAWFEGSAAGQRLLAADSPLAAGTVHAILQRLPELGRLRPDLVAERAVGPLQQLFAALTDALLALGGDPPVLFLDDAQWADATTLAWLSYTLARRRTQPLLLVAAYRPQDIDDTRAQVLNAWELDTLAQRLPVLRLTPPEAHSLVQALDGDPALALNVVAQSQGNPYILKELLRAAPGSIPERLRARVAACVADLPSETQQVIEAAAVLDPYVTGAMLRRVSGRSEDETLAALDRFLRTELLVAVEGHYAFAHPLVAATLRQELSPARRTALLQRGAAPLQRERAS